jgi:hypothetical protein
VVDHHVDRPEVEARQRVQLTGPNRSKPSSPAPSPKRASRARGGAPEDRGPRTEDRRRCPNRAGSPAGLGSRIADLGTPCPSASRLQGPDQEARPPGFAPAPCPLASGLGPLSRLGDHSVRAPPDPIPNSAVKPHRAQGTALLRVGERVVAKPGQRPQARHDSLPAPAGPQPSARRAPNRRGVEQPGSSSGS